MDVSLVMFKADGTRREFPLKKSRVIIGRINSCDLRIPLSSVSRQHCELRVGSGKIRIRDLGSSNGTFLNDTRITEGKLKAGDSIKIGPVDFTVVVDGVPATIEPRHTLLPSERDDAAAPPALAQSDEVLLEVDPDDSQPLAMSDAEESNLSKLAALTEGEEEPDDLRAEPPPFDEDEDEDEGDFALAEEAGDDSDDSAATLTLDDSAELAESTVSNADETDSNTAVPASSKQSNTAGETLLPLEDANLADEDSATVSLSDDDLEGVDATTPPANSDQSQSQIRTRELVNEGSADPFLPVGEALIEDEDEAAQTLTDVTLEADDDELDAISVDDGDEADALPSLDDLAPLAEDDQDQAIMLDQVGASEQSGELDEAVLSDPTRADNDLLDPAAGDEDAPRLDISPPADERVPALSNDGSSAKSAADGDTDASGDQDNLRRDIAALRAEVESSEFAPLDIDDEEGDDGALDELAALTDDDEAEDDDPISALEALAGAADDEEDDDMPLTTDEKEGRNRK